MKIGQKASPTQAAMAALTLLVCAGPAGAGVADTYYERAFVVAADDRCDLFEDRIGAALVAATFQARGAALRAGASARDLGAIHGRARARAGATACAHPDLARVAGRVESAFEGWARMPRMTFPGRAASWVADRAPTVAGGWSLSQAGMVGGSPVVLGRAQGDAPGLTAVVSFVGRPRPYAARLVLRDAAKAPRPWLVADGLAPAFARESVWAIGVSEADKGLLPAKRRQGQAWRFPASALTALETLDPREAFAVEFHFRDGTVATVRMEVGDLVAARAFADMGPL